MLSTRAIRGWTSGERLWFYLGEELGAAQAELVGARPSEVVVSGGITVNLHALLATFFRPSGLESIVESGDYQSYAEDRTSAA